MRQIDEEATSGEVRIGEDVAIVCDLAARHPRAAQQGEPVRGRARGRDLLDERDELAEVRAALGAVVEARIALEMLEAEHAAERDPVRGRRGTDHEVSVRCADRLIRSEQLVRRPSRTRYLAGREVRP